MREPSSQGPLSHQNSQLESASMESIPATQLHATAPLQQLQQAANASPQVQQLRQLQANLNPKASPMPLQRAQVSPIASAHTQGSGLPRDLKMAMEQLSGMALDDVQVHYDSDKPATLQAHAFAQGAHIHLAPGQERHLAHEAWHVVQQKQGRVQATHSLANGALINGDAALEMEADRMGSQAMHLRQDSSNLTGQRPLQQASSPADVAQCYTDLDAGGYEMEGQNEEESFFTRQKKALGFRQEILGGKYGLHERIKRSNAPKGLLLADDGTMAIQKTTDEPKEFYATEEVVQQSNEQLQTVESAFQLETNSGLSIKTNEGQKQLHKVKPTWRIAPEEDQGGEFMKLISYICIDVASTLMGKAENYLLHEAVFQSGENDEPNIARLVSEQKYCDKRLGTLSRSMVHSDQNTSKQDLRDSMFEEKAPKLPGIQYGKALRTGQLDESSKLLGVNEYAKPKVGEAYATNSMISHSNFDSWDYSRGIDPVLVQNLTWGYHFAGVIARSLDGADSITFENYNREANIMEGMGLILQDFLEQHQNELQEVWEEVVQTEGQDLRLIPGKLQRATEVVNERTRSEAIQDYNEMREKYEPERSWFFRMQGSKPGQSFHEQQVESGEYYNPLTVRVRRPDPQFQQLLLKAKIRLIRHPNFPEGLSTHPGFKDYEDLRQICAVEVMNQENPEKLEEYTQRELPKLSRRLLQGIARTQVALVREHGVALPSDILDLIEGEMSLQALSQVVLKIGEITHMAITRKVDNIGIFDDFQLDLRLTPFKVFNLWEMVPEALDLVNR